MGQISMIWVDSTFIYGKGKEEEREERRKKSEPLKAGWDFLARTGSSAEYFCAKTVLAWALDDARGSRASHLIF